MLWDWLKGQPFETIRPRVTTKHTAAYIAIGGLLGLLSGMVGIGGGIFLAPIFTLLRAVKPKEIACTSAVFILVNSASGLIGQLQKSGLNSASPNLLQRQFSVDRPDIAWFTDITYTRAYRGGLYLAIVLSLSSRKVIGWPVRSSLSKESVLDACMMAVWRRLHKAPVLIHSDQDSQYGRGA